MDGGTWWATVHGVAKSQTQLKQLRTQHAQDVLVMDCYRFLAYFIMIRKLFWEIVYYFPNFLSPKCIVVSGTAIKVKNMIKSS